MESVSPAPRSAAPSNPLINPSTAALCSPWPRYWEAQVKRPFPLDHSANGEDGVDAYAYAIDLWFAYERAARACGCTP